MVDPCSCRSGQCLSCTERLLRFMVVEQGIDNAWVWEAALELRMQGAQKQVRSLQGASRPLLERVVSWIRAERPEPRELPVPFYDSHGTTWHRSSGGWRRARHE